MVCLAFHALHSHILATILWLMITSGRSLLPAELGRPTQVNKSTKHTCDHAYPSSTSQPSERNSIWTMTHSSTKDIKTASAYINNLLLARGLLRDGKPLDFARLARSAQRKDQTSVEVSNSDIVAQVINVVHDMVLRRDVRAYDASGSRSC